MHVNNVDGFVSPGFEPVRAAFVENFARRGELGGACCVYQDGEKVVDLWGGLRDRMSGEPWREDTMAVVHSTTKGLSAMVMALAHSRRWLDYDERVCTYWPEFAQNGKDGITIRQLLAHQAGLFAFDEPVDREVIADLDRLAAVMARQRPAWGPGERQAYHAINLRSPSCRHFSSRMFPCRHRVTFGRCLASCRSRRVRRGRPRPPPRGAVDEATGVAGAPPSCWNRQGGRVHEVVWPLASTATTTVIYQS